MKTARVAVSIVGALLIGGGYFVSQYQYFLGDPASYARSLDKSSVPLLSLALLALAVSFAFVRDEESAR